MPHLQRHARARRSWCKGLAGFVSATLLAVDLPAVLVSVRSSSTGSAAGR
ncbi:hypothetical protein ACFPN0_31480 [Kitasatospora cinereorecta]